MISPAIEQLIQRLESVYREMGTVRTVIGRKVVSTRDDLDQVATLSRWQGTLWDALLTLRQSEALLLGEGRSPTPAQEHALETRVDEGQPQATSPAGSSCVSLSADLARCRSALLELGMDNLTVEQVLRRAERAATDLERPITQGLREQVPSLEDVFRESAVVIRGLMATIGELSHALRVSSAPDPPAVTGGGEPAQEKGQP